MRESNRETVAEMAIAIKVLAENGRYDPIRVAGLADSISNLAIEDAFPRREPAIAGGIYKIPPAAVE
jgi:hypothetical protein